MINHNTDMNDRNTMRKIVLICLFAALAIGSALSAEKSVERKIDELISKMTLEEKIGQLNQQTGQGYSDDMVRQIKAGTIGSILNETDPETVNRLQCEAMKNSRLHIPLIFARDVIHGFKTIFPIPLGQAASWNPELVEAGARVAAEEAASVGIRWTFSPMLDISRDARWGRCAESAGEDPYLTTQMGVAMVRGYQTDNLANPGTMAACTKHFFGYGASEAGLDYNSTWIPPVQLHNVFLPAYEAAVRAGSATVMVSFNDNDGLPTNADRGHVYDMLRGQWGFDGVVVSDWASLMQLQPQGYCANLKECAAVGANTGVDIDMESYAYTNHLKALVEEGKVDMKTIDEMVRNVLRLKFRLGLFDKPYVDMKTANTFYQPQSFQKAIKMIEESTILLKNNGLLPLQEGKKIALVGPMIDAKHDQAGTWSFDLEKGQTVTPLESLRELLGSDNVIAEAGLAYSRDKSEEGIARAVEAAKKADLVVMVAGEEAVLSGEAHCRADISLPGAQTKMLDALKATGKPVVLIIMAGRPLTIVHETETADATLFMFHPGTMGGPAIANMLYGKSVPSGKLPMTFPKLVGQEPIYYNHNNTARPATEVQYIDDIPLEAGQTSTGCSAFYLDAGNTPAFPFGYGLSYTTFSYGDVRLSADTMSKTGEIKATCTVTNTGNCEAKETVQLYVRDLVGSVTRPVRELKGFEKISLRPGESRDVTFTLKAADLAFYNRDLVKAVEPGDFQLWISTDSASGNPVSFKVTE